MTKRFGYSAVAASVQYVAANSDVYYVLTSGGATFSAMSTTNGHIVSARVSAADFTIASGNPGVILTVGRKGMQTVDGSGTATHVYLCNTSAERINYVTEVTNLVLASSGVVTLNTWDVTANQTATNSS